MRAGLNTIQQTLTPEAATVLNHSIAEAGRRNHGQTTPLHVAATLLSAPSGFLRQACIKSHPNSSHPLQCRALELCFSVALERLPTAAHTTTTTPALEPPISNALMAALKRAQAHQRRGCPEQQQQPLLAVKVELEQLIISILDDPSVSRVMREASFSSLAVKATIEQSMNSSNSNINSSPIGLGFRPAPTGIIAGPPNRNSYLNPRLQQGTGQRSEEVKKVVDILMRTKKMNPVLVGDSEPEAVIKELFRRIESKELNQGLLKNVEVIHLEKELASDKAQIPGKIKELGNLVESRIANSKGGGVILDLGDLKWLVEHWGSFGVPGAVQVVSEAGRAAVAEMVKILARFREGSGARLWLIGIATCETYMRCQIYHPTMESDWDLQALPIATRSPLPGMFPRLGTNIILNSVEFLPALKGFPPTTAPPSCVSENSDPDRRAASCCPLCTQNYEQELAKLVAKEFEKSSSEVKLAAARLPLPQWLQNAKAEVKTTGLPQAKDQELMLKQKTQELQKKWNDTCLHLHPNFHQHNCSERIVPTPISMTGLYSPNLLGCQPFQPKLSPSKNLGANLQLNTNPVAIQSPERTCSPSVCPVRTELVLGRTKLTETTTPQIIHKERVQDLSGCVSSESQSRLHELQSDKLTASTLDADSFKRLLKGLMEKVWWQQDAASAVAATVTQCKLGNGNQRGAGSRGDVWLLFTGPEKVGKKKMASALSELVSGANPIVISLGCRRDGRESELNFRGKTVLDRISEAVRRNPFSVIMLEDIDEADMIFCGNIKRAMERGRLVDSYGREVSLGNVIFILTANWLPENLKFVSYRDEEKLANLAKGGWQLKLSLCEKSSKRRPNWLHHDQDRATKPRKETASTLSFDLNEAADDAEDDRQDGVNNSSDLTIDHEEDNRRLLTASSVFRELLNSVDDTIVFKPVNFGAIRCDITNSIAKKFSTIVKFGISMEVQDDALEKILSGVWLGGTRLDEWAEKVLVPSLQQLKSRMSSTISGTPNESLVVRLELDGDSNSWSHGDWLPSSIKVVVDGL